MVFKYEELHLLTNKKRHLFYIIVYIIVSHSNFLYSAKVLQKIWIFQFFNFYLNEVVGLLFIPPTRGLLEFFFLFVIRSMKLKELRWVH